MNRKTLLFSLIYLLSLNIIVAQATKGYSLGVGAKVGKFSSGVSGKYFIGTDNSTAIDGSFTVKKNFGTGMFTGLIVKQFPIFHHTLQIPLDAYFGGGFHVATYKAGYYRIRNKEKESYYGSGISLGLDAVIGLEYLPARLPLSLSAEAIPMLDLVNPGPEKVELALSVRYLF